MAQLRARWQKQKPVLQTFARERSQGCWRRGRGAVRQRDMETV